MTSEKGFRWTEFNKIVFDHVENYSVPQYGEDIKDNSDVASAEDCLKYIAKYIRRAGSARRGRIEELRDLLKIAHFAQFAFDFMNPTEDELKALKEGRR